MLQLQPVMATALEVLLVEHVDKLGEAGNLVKVKPGYARNYLFPQGLAIFADAHTIDLYERRRAKYEAQAQEKKEKAEANKANLDDASITVKASAGAAGKLFGAITKEDIANAIQEQHNIAVDKNKVKIKFPIKAIGEHKAVIGLGVPGVESEILVKVEAQG